MNPFVQELEGRRLLSATLTSGVLDIEGSKANNNITVSLSADGTTLTVTESIARRGHKASAGTTTTFAAADVSSIVANGGAGNDNIVFKALGSTAFTTPAVIDGGAGNDWIRAAGGADSISGGDGDDKIEAGDGADTVNGGDGDDKINGGAGADLLNGDDGDDDLTGGADADTMNGGDGDDVFRAAGDSAVDTIDGGADSAETGEDDQDTAVVDATDTVTDVVSNATIGSADDLHGACPGSGRGGAFDFGASGFTGFSTRRHR